MDRTVELNDNWFFYEGEKAPSKRAPVMKEKSVLPCSSKSVFTLKRKFICPKQINDTVTVFFTGNYGKIILYAGKNQIHGKKDEEDRYIFDVTPFIGRGIVCLTAVFSEGSADGFYYSVKRKV